MFVKMGYKTWTYDTQKGLRIYTSTIRKLVKILNVPSANSNWKSLDEFLNAIENNEPIVQPYTRNILAISPENEHLLVHLSINKHGNTSQGYITAPMDTWLENLTETFLDEDFNFEYLVGSNQDILVVPKYTVDIIAERKEDDIKIKNKFLSFCNRKNNHFPPNPFEIGLYFELEEMKILKSQGFRPSHRFPHIISRINSLKQCNISCDIDLLDDNKKFIKFIEVKAIGGTPGNPFSLTINEWKSREWCRQNDIAYEVVVYYHAGCRVLERRVVTKDEDLITKPSGFWCSFP